MYYSIYILRRTCYNKDNKKIVAETYVIGDAVKARKALDATAEGLNTALEI